MLPKNLLLIILFLAFPLQGIAEYVVDNRQQKEILKDSLFVFKDQSQSLTIHEITQQPFSLSKTTIPNFGWGKSVCWVRFSFSTSGTVSNEFLLHVNSAIFDEISFYLFEENKIVDKFEEISSKTPLTGRYYPHRDFVFPLKIQPGHRYTVYLKGRNLFNNNKFPLIIWEKDAFEQSERMSNLFWGIFLGIFLLIAILNFTIGFVSKMKVFNYYGMYVISLMLIFLNLEGYFYEYVPKGIFQNSVYNIYPYFNYSSIFWTALFILSFTKLSLTSKPYLERGLRILAIFFWVLLIPSIFSPLWQNAAGDTFLLIWGWLGRIFILIILVWSLVSILYSTSGNQMAVIYLIASIPPILSYIIPQYFNPVFNFWIVQPYAYLVGFLIEIIILSVAMIFRIRAFLFRTEEIPETGKPEPKVISESNGILSKRETEILKAFANGFSYQEIASAMFISPHTVRTHIKNIYTKLQINSKAEAVRYIVEQERAGDQ
ncbi:hypothetical protein GVN16_22960 [Emticicia sp. CRIBPO]|uniref:7TM-DISM domain-containing protein n=1 Tax=Emticicia sp. CRIBPO TaxID=2683258 RepID=UPI0014124E8B|nr:7TM-DISM domain-containing protein [Emticicia sp. CRIBPO]NBA88652.1 hypothetical protein [Emticicia sp. CRIBPO]